MTITQHYLAIQAENEKLKKENEIMRQIGSVDGFYDLYFKVIPNYTSRIDAFNEVNDLHKKYFGCFRYANYWSFKRVVNRRIKG